MAFVGLPEETVGTGRYVVNSCLLELILCYLLSVVLTVQRLHFNFNINLLTKKENGRFQTIRGPNTASHTLLLRVYPAAVILYDVQDFIARVTDTGLQLSVW